MAQLYADENFPKRTVEALRHLGHDVLTARDAGNAGQSVSDPDVLSFAHAHGRAVLTFDRRDFRRLDRLKHPHSGIVICTNDPDRDRLATRIHAQIELYESQPAGLVGQIVRVVKPNR